MTEVQLMHVPTAGRCDLIGRQTIILLLQECAKRLRLLDNVRTSKVLAV